MNSLTFDFQSVRIFEDRLPGAIKMVLTLQEHHIRQTAALEVPLAPSTPSDASIRGTNVAYCFIIYKGFFMDPVRQLCPLYR